MYVTKAREDALVYTCHPTTFSVFINFFFFPQILKKYYAVFYNISKHYLYKIKSWPMIHNSAIEKEYNPIQQVLKINIQVRKYDHLYTRCGIRCLQVESCECI